MIFQRNKLAALALAVCFTQIACKQTYLERDPYGILDQQEFFKTDGAGLKLLTSCYQPMRDGWGYTVNKIAIGD